jgi:hypothetical protein
MMLRISKLTFLNAVVLPMALGLGACFFGDDEGLDEGISGTGGGTPCNIGAAGCPCTTQGACDPGLSCQDQLDVCVLPDGCPTGEAGCECTEGGACDPGLICNQDICVSDMPCPPEQTGTESCQCTDGGGCDPGLECLSSVCVNVPATTTETTTGEVSTGQDTTGATDTDASTGVVSNTGMTPDGTTAG